MTARMIDKVWTGIFYAVAAAVIGLLIFFLPLCCRKERGFGNLSFCSDGRAIRKRAVALVRS